MSPASRVNVGVLVSGSGTNLQALLDAETRQELRPARISCVISNRPGVGALERAATAGKPAIVIDSKAFPDRAPFEEALLEQLARYDAELVVLAGFMRILTPRFLDRFPNRVLNIHPSLLPAFPGIDAQRQAFEHGVKVTGATVHFVDAGLDAGPIIAQAAVAIADDDTIDSLRARILEREHELLPRAVQAVAAGALRHEGRRVLGR